MKKTVILLLVLVLGASLFAQSLSDLKGLDSVIVKPYSKKLDKVGTVLSGLSVASAAVLATSDSDYYFTIGTMYLETMGLTYGTKELIKHFVPKDRPYTYYPESAPVDETDDWDRSFPSGHTAMAFAGAAFTSYVFCKLNPDSDWRVPVVLGCTALASATAAVRVAGGCHFVTDVLAGAIIGTAIGIGIPALHTVKADSSESSAPFTLAFSISL